ncbi:hypothetical protein QJS10_CPB13g00214 [Acorus calamus]|uniref:Uncharacterized protein n=1 Tax=Acorus calamus TaxID=4465 RepID=A0AAV9DEG7_ACOCL|nr:hypothetical protein QJS10_CPB13g00214 [Acorus calamus]
MSIPLEQQQQQQPPPLALDQTPFGPHRGHGSFGPVIAVLAVIAILCVVAGMIGRICSGRRVFGHGQYDFEGWIERKCSSCIDGHIEPPRPPPPEPPTSTAAMPSSSSSVKGGGKSVPIVIPIETPQEAKGSRNPSETA